MQQVRKTIGMVILISLAVILASTCCAGAAEKVNINTASLEQLMSLDRVGAKYAQRIIDYRETIGPFEKPEDIMKVKGVGKKTWEANKERIAV